MGAGPAWCTHFRAWLPVQMDHLQREAADALLQGPV